MKLRFLLFVFSLAGSVTSVFSQAANDWRIEVIVIAKPKNCFRAYSQSINVKYQGQTYTNPSGLNTSVSFVIAASEAILLVGNIEASGLGNCDCGTTVGCAPSGSISTQTLAVPDVSSSNGRCTENSQSYASGNYDLTISYKIYKRMESPTIGPQDCTTGGVQLSTGSISGGSYIWEVTDDLTTPIVWKTFATTSANAVYASIATLNNGFTKRVRFVRVNDSGCLGRVSGPSASFIVKRPAPTGATISWKDPTCYGYDNGEVTVSNIQGSVSAYLVSLQIWDAGSNDFKPIYQPGLLSGESITIRKSDIPGPHGIKKGLWRIKIINNEFPNDYGNCEKVFPETSIGEPSDITITTTTSASIHNGYAISCHGGSDGSISASASGGTPGYSYKWSTNSTSASISSLPIGTYTITVTDANSCVKETSVELNQPNPLVASISNKSPSCAGYADGELTATATGGVPGYTYVWSTAESGNVAHNLSQGNYSVTVKDLNNCPDSESTFLDAPLPILVIVDGVAPTCANGNDGRVWVSDVQNELGTIGYSWTPGNENTDQIIGLTKGTYSVTVSSTSGGKTCTGSASKVLIDPTSWTASIEPVLQYNGKAISCNGASDGRLNVVVKDDAGVNAVGEYYTWSTGENGNTKNFLDNLPDENYEVTVRYNGNCEVKSSFRLYDPEPVVVTIDPTIYYNGQLISCYNKADASVEANVSGGTGLSSAFSYQWNTGLQDSVLAGIGAGEYRIAVKDINGCEAKDTLVIENPAKVKAEIVSYSVYEGYGVKCFGNNDGFIVSSATGGTEVFTYVWSNGKSTSLNDQLMAGIYKVVVSDDNGCMDSILHEVTTPPVLKLEVASVSNISCFGGDDGIITLHATGGVNNYKYSIDGGTNWQDSFIFNNKISAGNYSLTLRDANLCSATVSTLLTQPSQLNISFTDIKPAFCADPRGSITGVVSGGVGNYTYEWRRKDQPAILSTKEIIDNIPAGIYELSVNDGNTCSTKNSASITSTDGAKTDSISLPARCFDSSDGIGEIIIEAGDGPFTYEWPDASTSFKNENLKAGLYDVEVTDVHGCTVIQSVEIKAPDPLQVNIKGETRPTCYTFCDGKLTLKAIGGVGNYTYEWNSKVDSLQTNLCAAKYPVIVTDANGCVLKDIIELKQPDALDFSVVKETLATCKDGCDGALEVRATGGNGGYQYVWANGGTSETKSNICHGDYQISVTDEKGCTTANSVTLRNTPALPVDLGGGVTLCVGQKHTLDAGPAWRSVQWKGVSGFTSAESKVVIKDPGEYFLEVYNSNGCVGRDTFLLETSLDLLKAKFLLTTEAMVGDTVVMVNISYPLPENVTWNCPVNMKRIVDGRDVIYGQFDEAGIYEVSISTQLGECQDQLTKSITILESKDIDEGGRIGYEQFVLEFILYPNANNGSFNVGVKLLEESAIALSIWNAINNRFIGKVLDKGKKSYLKHVDLRPLASGSYVLRLDHDRGSKYIRFNVQ
jgi:hypothetical protein